MGKEASPSSWAGLPAFVHSERLVSLNRDALHAKGAAATFVPDVSVRRMPAGVEYVGHL
jgi:hypothetical protein